jgi:iron complex outermembrane receptor protein
MNKKECCLAMAVMMMMDAAAAQGAMAAEKTQKSVPEAAPMDTYALDDTIVTATRSHKRDVDTPAATTIITEKQIKEQGSRNAAEVLSKVNGFAYKSFGPAGVSMGTMNNEINIRGVKNGTLVLVNGSPISWRSKYNIEEIPADIIQRVEIVKGGGSVLYGSEAMGGVVNIITKKGGTNEARIGFGNYGQQQYYVNTGNERFGVHYSSNKWKRFDGASYTELDNGQTRTDLRDIDQENAGFDFAINPRLDLAYNYFKTENDFRRYVTRIDQTGTLAETGDLFNNRKYTTKQHAVQLNYHDGAWKGNVYFNTGTVESQGHSCFDDRLHKVKADKAIYNTLEKNQSIGIDTQRDWQFDTATKATAGLNLQHEIYQVLPAHETPVCISHSRNDWGVFGQLEHVFNKRDTGTLGGT